MNIAIITGRFTRDPELKYTQAGKAVCNFTLAVDNPYKKDDASFINCVAWEKKAEIISEYMRKGAKMGVNGRIVVSSFDDSEGKKRTKTEILVEGIEFLDNKKEEKTERVDKESENKKYVNDDTSDYPF